MAGVIHFNDPRHPNNNVRKVMLASPKPTEPELSDGGPTVEEFVKAGYDPKNYPPKGYDSKSDAAAIAKAIAEYKPKDK